DLTPGAFGQSGTVVLYGGNIDGEVRPGGLFSAGVWLDEGHKLGMDGRLFFLGRRSADFVAGSNCSPILARPFFDAFTGSQSAHLVTAPDIAAGKIGVGLRTRLWGSEANLCSQLATGDSFRLKALAGFRYLELSERLDIDEGTLLTLANPVGALGGATVFSSD